jgi:PEP-CTERM motif
MRHFRLSPGLAAAAMALGLAAATLPAQAVVVYSGPVNLAVPNTAIGLYLNVVTGTSYSGPNTFPSLGGPGQNYDLNMYVTGGAWTLFSPGTSGQSTPTPVPTTSKGYVAVSATGAASNLAVGTLIGGSSVFNTGTPDASALATGGTTILGFRFRNEGPDLTVSTDDTVHFGWARFNLAPGGGSAGTLIDYAFESTPLTAIAAGVTTPIPEPASLALFGAGLLGLLGWKKRQQR